MNSNIFKEINSLLEIFFLSLGIFTFKDLINFKYSKNLKVETVFLTTAATQTPTKKLTKDTPIALTVIAKAPMLTPPLITPHFKLRNSCLLDALS